ncbi:sensor histidine kinase [Candidatus Magnetaquicoccus inordinatus]|uniref:sensor histidine kinase n=1 Tax=Candidatus Magnetaquicoccus inordinatus TaxID=2496818 RepID=UPI00187D6918|nr:HAMP domain-containing sensor histidine kinase [Candidatus Magnetaquicoccus inordinatus]MBF0155190.1 HAMP domain-containing histidine kinase [Magnetococcales bacterium]
MLELHTLLMDCANRADPLLDRVLLLLVEQRAKLAERRINDQLLVELVRQLVESERQLNEYKENLLQANETLERQYRALIEAEKLKQDVELITRHDMKSPLNGVIGFADLLLSTTLSAEQEKHVKTIRKSGVTVLHMINLSLGLYRMEQGIYQLDVVEIDLLPIIQSVRNDATALIAGNRLILETRIQGKPVVASNSFFIRGEEVLCYSMLANLIKNALEASPEGGVVTIDMEGQEDRGVVRIRNQGAVPKEIRGSFFEKYATSGKSSGTGLGTYSAKLIVETMGGTIQMNSSDDGWTEVTIVVPIGEHCVGVPGESGAMRSVAEAELLTDGAHETDEHRIVTMPTTEESQQTVPDQLPIFLFEFSQHMESLSRAVELQNSESALQEALWMRSRLSEVSAVRVATQALRLYGLIEADDWEDVRKAFQAFRQKLNEEIAKLIVKETDVT